MVISLSVSYKSLRSASRGDLIIPRFRLRTVGFRAFAISGPPLWNLLPLDVRQSRDNLMQFKRNWKHCCSSSVERFCGSKYNEGPYKCSILLLLLLVVLPLQQHKILRESRTRTRWQTSTRRRATHALTHAAQKHRTHALEHTGTPANMHACTPFEVSEREIIGGEGWK